MQGFITPVLLTVGIAFVSAVMLTLAAKFMSVPVDEKAVKIRECLPGANCGGCGFAGCDDYAASLAKDPDHIKPTLCAPGGSDAANAIADILGVKAEALVPKKSTIMCSGYNDITKKQMEFQGGKTCASVKDFFGGPSSCKYGCLGYGDCANVCVYNAIEICNGVAKVNRDLCVGCGTCATVCPKGIISILPESNRVFVGCSSCDAGKVTRDFCEVGCIGCKICEKNCKFDAIHVINGNAVVDPDKCKNCGLCAKACPRHIIHVLPKPIKKVEVAPES